MNELGRAHKYCTQSFNWQTVKQMIRMNSANKICMTRLHCGSRAWLKTPKERSTTKYCWWFFEQKERLKMIVLSFIICFSSPDASRRIRPSRGQQKSFCVGQLFAIFKLVHPLVFFLDRPSPSLSSGVNPSAVKQSQIGQHLTVLVFLNQK